MKDLYLQGIEHVLLGPSGPRNPMKIAQSAHRLCRLIWIILHHGVWYEGREPAVSKSSRRTRTAKMIRELRLLGYRIEPLSVPPANPA